MKKNPLKEKSDKELLKTLHEKRKALRLFRFAIAGTKTKNVKEGMTLRKEIARILTEQNVRAKAGVKQLS